jgi:hypothetical protein
MINYIFPTKMEVYMRFFISAKFIEENISGIVDL